MPHTQAKKGMLALVFGLTIQLTACASQRDATPPPTDDPLMWAWMGEGTGDIAPMRDEGGEWWTPGDCLWSERANEDGSYSNRICFAVLDEHGQWQPNCAACGDDNTATDWGVIKARYR